MYDPLFTALHDWQPFYCMTGEVAGTLMGLMFISMSLGSRVATDDISEQKRHAMANKVRAFVSPTIIHLTSVVIVSAVMCMPLHRSIGLCSCLGLVGLAGALYLASTLRAMREHQRMTAVKFDHWLFHLYLPLLCYFAALGNALALPYTHDGLPILAGATIVFLAVGIRNSWLSTLYTSGLLRH